jgi:acetyltransferase AlgX (SGNH hydrolase-like protein)
MMRRWRLLTGNFLIAAVSIVFTIALLEIVLRFLPVAWAPPVQPPTADNPIQRYAPNISYTWSLGWNFYVVTHGRTNAQGFIANFDYDATATTPLVAVVGDSFIEALQVPFAESLTGRLQDAMGNSGRAYAFAQSGSPLSQYIAYVQHASTTYHPQKIVVTVVGNDFDESIYSHRKRDGIYHLYPRSDGDFDFKLTPLPMPGLVERILRHSALALYMVRNVGISNVAGWFKPKTAQAGERSDVYVGQTLAAADPARIAEGERIIAWFLTNLRRAASLAPRDIVIVIDGMRPQLYYSLAPAAAPRSYFGLMRGKLISEAKARGFQVIDMERVFRAAYAVNHLPFEYPNDAHWNPHGHAVVAAAVREALSGWAPLNDGTRSQQ